MTPEPAQPAESPEARAKRMVAWLQDCGMMEASPETLWAVYDMAPFVAMLAASTARPTEREAVEEDLEEQIAEALDESLEVEWTTAAGARHVMGFLRAKGIVPATDQAAEVEVTPALLGEVMQDAWGEICDDAGAHPSDIQHGRGSVLFYSPGHWTDLIALRLSEALATQTATGRTMGGEEAAWRDGFDNARRCISEDEAFCLTEDVEEDAWRDSDTRAALREPRP